MARRSKRVSMGSPPTKPTPFSGSSSSVTQAFASTFECWLKAEGPSKGERALSDSFVDELVPERGWLVDRVTGRAG